MSFTGVSLRRCAALLAAVLATSSVSLLSSAAAEAAAPAPTTVSATWSATKVVLGRAASVSGRVTSSSSGERTVRLLQKFPDGWSTVREQTTTADGSYALRLPTDWYHKSRFVVSAPATSQTQAATSLDKVVSVVPSYQPAGSASSWSRLSRNTRYRWDPCQVITYRVNAAKATRGALTDTKKAFRRLGQATGMRYKYLGSTKAIPGSKSAWPSDASFVVAWAKPRQTSVDLSGNIIGWGGAQQAWPAEDSSGSIAEITRGEVVIDATANLKAGFGRNSPRSTRGHILMHEIAHASGLGHTNGRKQIMMPSTDRSISARWGAGDLRGLGHIGRAQGCITSSHRTTSAQRVSSPGDVALVAN